jgi:hypothetical protein
MARAKEVLKKELLELDPAERAEVAEAALRSLAGSTYGELSRGRRHADAPGVL